LKVRQFIAYRFLGIAEEELAVGNHGVIPSDSAEHLDRSNLFAPLFLDLDPRRFASPVTWRRLTVAENLEIQPPGVAVGYRVQCGKKQWLIYRSLAPQGNRTLIGHNLCSEFLCGSLDRQGNVTTMVEIE
jgi:hypothetical protein